MPDHPPNNSQKSPPAVTLPPRPLCRPAPPRAATACFWGVFLFFLAALGFLGQLAYTRNAGQSQPNSGTGGHLVSALVLVGFAVATVIGVVATRYKRLH